ncbi:hypothetical protein [Streptacidiphilus carbonis]|uniref:hypothetical protein n=1 Tax=Streptacidiphilus carbonis TaxID=105422 RepID=UPI0005AAB857|nr:hypothetical protein [Streptacidiphilus carbonis]
MGLFTRSGFTFDAVVADGVIYDAVTDADGRVWLDGYDEDFVVVIDGVLIGDFIYPAYLGDDGRLYLEEND